MSGSPDETKAPTVFARESTGLVKNVSFLDSIALNLSNMSIGPLLTTIAGSTTATLFIVPSVTGLNLVAASVIAFILAIPQIVVYTMMSRRFPRTGGDYVWISRTFGGFFGSTMSFFGYTMETLAFLALVAILTDFTVGSAGLTMSFTYWGYQGVGAPPYFNWFNLFSDPATQFLVGAVPFAAVILLNIWKPKVGYRLVSVLTIIGVITLLLSMAELLYAGQAGVKAYIDGTAPYLQYGGANSTYEYLSSHYAASGGLFDINFGNTIYIMPVVFAFVYPWLNAAPAVASEIKDKRALKWNVPISAVTALVLLTGALAVLYGVAGMPFVNSAFASHAWANDGLNFFTLAMAVSGNIWIAGIIGIGSILMQFGVIAYGVIVFSRYMLAQSLDRFLPAKLSYVSPRFGSPMVAMAVDLVVAVLLIGLASYFSSSFFALFGTIIASMIYFTIVGLTAATHGIKKEKGSARTLLAVFGILDAGAFAFLVYQYLTSPTFSIFTVNPAWLNETYILSTLIAGALIYLASRWYHKKRGMNIDLNYKELPPD
ncbi:MAG: APC family permease [Thaumarchaeota archaeon]|nr:APC family permease [Nitrososphaerota archaeon]